MIVYKHVQHSMSNKARITYEFSISHEIETFMLENWKIIDWNSRLVGLKLYFFWYGHCKYVERYCLIIIINDSSILNWHWQKLVNDTYYRLMKLFMKSPQKVSFDGWSGSSKWSKSEFSGSHNCPGRAKLPEKLFFVRFHNMWTWLASQLDSALIERMHVTCSTILKQA